MAAGRGKGAARPRASAARPRSPDAAIAEVVNHVRRLDRGLRLIAREVEAAGGVSAAQLFVLEQLAATPAASIGDLAERTHTDRSSVSVVVERLVERGLALRRQAPDDRRRAEVRVSAAGRALLARAPKPPTARLLDALAAMPPRRRAALAAGLAELNERLGLAGAPAPLLFDSSEGR